MTPQQTMTVTAGEMVFGNGCDQRRGWMPDLPSSACQRDRLAARGLALEAGAFACELRQHLTLVIAQREARLVVAPFAAGEEFSGTAALRRNRAFSAGGAGHAEGHRALPAARRAERPAAGEIDRTRQCRLRRRLRRP